MAKSITAVMAETDILQFLDEAFCTAGAFGYGVVEDVETVKAMDELVECLEEMEMDMDDGRKRDIEPIVSELTRASGEEGFKRGFSIALRLMMAGFSTSRG